MAKEMDLKSLSSQLPLLAVNRGGGKGDGVFRYKCLDGVWWDDKRSADGHESSTAEDSASGALRTTSAHRYKARIIKDRQLGLEGGPSNYYRSVTVCASCYRVYCTLDRAREMLRAQEDRQSGGTDTARKVRAGQMNLWQRHSSKTLCIPKPGQGKGTCARFKRL